MAPNTPKTSVPETQMVQMDSIASITPDFGRLYLPLYKSTVDLAAAVVQSKQDGSKINAYDLALLRQSVHEQTVRLVGSIVAALERYEPEAQIRKLDSIYAFLEAGNEMTNYYMRSELEKALSENNKIIDLTQKTNAGVASALYVN